MTEPMNADNANPLLDFSGLPRFDAIRAEHVTPAVDRLLADARAAVDAVATDSRPATWDNVAEPLAEPLDRLDRAWGAVRHLNAVVSTPELRGAYHAQPARRSPHSTPTWRRISGSSRVTASSPRRRRSRRSTRRKRRAVDNELRDFRLGGAELPAPQKARLKAVEEELAELVGAVRRQRARCDQRLGALRRPTRRELAGVPDTVLAEARAAAEADGKRRLEAHAAHAVLPAGDELRRQPRAARDAASRLRDARVRPRRVARSGTTVR